MASPNRNAQQNENDLVPQSMEGGETSMDNHPVTPVEYPQFGKFIWRIEHFSSLSVEGIYSVAFEIGFSKWRVLIFPRSYNCNHLSLYLDVADSTSLPDGWSIFASFSLAIVNQIYHNLTIRKVSWHRFSAEESDQGFSPFVSLMHLHDPNLGYLVNDVCIIEAEIVVHGVMDHQKYNSKEKTGFVGLINQGATCYLNSVLQMLYHIPYFRKVVYQMPTIYTDGLSSSIPLALQKVFYDLQYNNNHGETNVLTSSFGWGQSEIHIQRDAHEINRFLCSNLDYTMKGTIVDGALQNLFEGHHLTYIECVNVDYRSNRIESFYDLQLVVKGCSNVYASFDKFVEAEYLDGENKYEAEGHGLQDARKGALFLDFPPVLQLHLKRFEYDYIEDIFVKINDYYEFPLQLDLDIGNGKYLSPETDRSVCNLYALHSVLVHEGDANGGHYYVFIRPDLSSQWYKFDDDRVTREDMDKVMRHLYGGEEHVARIDPQTTYAKHSNAYMLQYIRESDKEEIFCGADEQNINVHLRERLRRELEKRKKEKVEAIAGTIVKVATDEDFSQQVGQNVFFDLVDLDRIRSFRVQKSMLFNIFKEVVAKELCVPVQFQRYWAWTMFDDGSCRPFQPISLKDETQTVGFLKSLYGIHGELKIFLEVNYGQELSPMPLPHIKSDDILLFFKVYDPRKLHLRYAGKLLVKKFSMIVCILPKLKAFVGFDPMEDIELFKELGCMSNDMCEPINKLLSFSCNELEDGDIICFQKSISPQFRGQFLFPDVPAFLLFQHNLQEFSPMPLPHIKSDDILLFFKVYDPKKLHLRYAGKLLVKKFSMIVCILPKLKELVGFDPMEDIKLFKELGCMSNVMCKPINKLLSFSSNELEDGDIIRFQKSDFSAIQGTMFVSRCACLSAIST